MADLPSCTSMWKHGSSRRSRRRSEFHHHHQLSPVPGHTLPPHHTWSQNSKGNRGEGVEDPVLLLSTQLLSKGSSHSWRTEPVSSVHITNCSLHLGHTGLKELNAPEGVCLYMCVSGIYVCLHVCVFMCVVMHTQCTRSS